MPKASAKTYEKDYTKPQLRANLKERIQRGAKGGKANQWSARKAQLLKKAYEEQGGGYKHSGQKTRKQKSLSQWTQEDWQTTDRKPAKRSGKSTRYLPAKVWKQLTPQEKRKTNALKVKGSQHGKKVVSNPKEVQAILKKVRSKQTSRTH